MLPIELDHFLCGVLLGSFTTNILLAIIMRLFRKNGEIDEIMKQNDFLKRQNDKLINFIRERME